MRNLIEDINDFLKEATGYGYKHNESTGKGYRLAGYDRGAYHVELFHNKQKVGFHSFPSASDRTQFGKDWSSGKVKSHDWVEANVKKLSTT